MNNDAREAILGFIRSNLAASVPFDPPELPVQRENPVVAPEFPVIELFKREFEAVDGHCIIANGDAEISQVLTQIITGLGGRRIAISDNPEVKRLLYLTDLEIEELGVVPSAADIFRFDVGITSAQAGIAETGTLVLNSENERHRLVSLVPPVHIAIVDASKIRATLGEALLLLRVGKEVSPAVTFVTGPSRTADIELTLAIGVHGPQELYVIVNSLS